MSNMCEITPVLGGEAAPVLGPWAEPVAPVLGGETAPVLGSWAEPVAPAPPFPLHGIPLLATCTGCRCVCDEFPATGICWAYSSEKDCALLTRALKEKAEGDNSLYELLTDRHEERDRVTQIAHKLSRVEADFRAFKDPFPGNFSGLYFSNINKAILSRVWATINQRSEGWELARIALDPVRRHDPYEDWKPIPEMRALVAAAAVPPAMCGAGGPVEPHLSVEEVMDHMYEISTLGWAAYVKAHR